MSGDYARDQKAKALWAKIMENERAVNAELAICKKEGRRTKHYEQLLKDSNKLREEYAQVLGTRPYDPHSLADVESAADATARKFLGGR